MATGWTFSLHPARIQVYLGASGKDELYGTHSSRYLYEPSQRTVS